MPMIFKPAARYPADPRAVFILALSVFSGVTALALDVAPGTLEATLPRWAVLGWGILLTLGSLVTLLGMLRQSVGGIITEQIGCVMVAATTIFYAGVAFSLVGAEALQNIGIILAWGLSCGLRWVQLQVLINSAAARAAKLVFLQKIEDDIIQRRAADAAREKREHHPDHTEWRHL